MYLANENFPHPSIAYLRRNGYTVRSVQEEMPGLSDEQVIATAQAEQLIILTFDSDYGELIFKYGVTNPPSVVYFRDKGDHPEYVGHLLLDLIRKSSIDFSQSFTVVEEKNIRQRFYKK